MLIRPLEDSDLDAVTALWDRCGLLRPWNNPHDDIGLARQTESAEIFVGTDGENAIVAAVMCGHDGHRGWLYYLAVDPGCRRQGLGRDIVAHAEAWLRGLGVRKLELMIRNTNKPVARFYEALGYREEPVTTLSRWLVEPAEAPDV
jgi:hypothetical protein